MRIWLIQVGEPLPTDQPTPRLMRTGQLARALSLCGHDVIWWASAFSHQTKSMRASGTYVVQNDEAKYRLCIVEALGYKSHVGFRRFVDEMLVARRIAKVGHQQTAPDLIIVSLPTLFGVFAAARMKRAFHCSLVIDVRDLWPDILLEKVPRALRSVFRIPVGLMRWRTSRALKAADVVTATSDDFVEWGISLAGRKRTQADRAFPLAYDHSVAILESDRSLEDVLPTHVRRNRLAVFAGTLVPQFDFDLVLKLAQLMPEISFVICGDGPLFESVRTRAPHNVYLTGWLGATDLRLVLDRADVALAPYNSTKDFEANIPNKIVEYLACGLPVISSLTDGLVANLLASHGVGTTAPRDDTMAWQSAISNLIALPEEQLRHISDRCQAIFRERFDAQRVALEYVRAMEEFVG